MKQYMEIAEFLGELERNNSLDWMHAHKKEYQNAKSLYIEFIDELLFQLRVMDPSLNELQGKQVVSRLNRDTRFSKDKSPYNPSFRSHLAPNPSLPIPVGYYIMVRSDTIMLGGGLFASMFKDATKMMRDYLNEHGQEFLDIIQDPQFASRFQVNGDALKKVPAPYCEDHPAADYLKMKSWYIEIIEDSAMLKEPQQFIDYCVEVFKAMKPFHEYINKALIDFKMPTR